MKLFQNILVTDKSEPNAGRQFEFDMAKFICILGMVFVHLFEEFPITGNVESGNAYYIMVIVLDAIFGAGTFMGCMGLGIAYSRNNGSSQMMKRGVSIFALAYLLNLIRDGIPSSILMLLKMQSVRLTLMYLLFPDILQFAGLALFLFGFLKKIKLSDLGILGVAIAMSIIGSVFRFVDIPNMFVAEIVSLFISAYCPTYEVDAFDFSLLNWFIIVVLGYLYGKFIRKVNNIEKYYSFALPVSAVLLGIYMAIAIPLNIGMMNEDISYYYAFVTPEALVLFVGMVFSTSVYHYMSKLFSVKVKNVITGVSANINTIYCIHWVILMWIAYVLEFFEVEISSSIIVFPIGIAIFTISALFADKYKNYKSNRKNKMLQQYKTEYNNHGC